MKLALKGYAFEFANKAEFEALLATYLPAALEAIAKLTPAPITLPTVEAPAYTGPIIGGNAKQTAFGPNVIAWLGATKDKQFRPTNEEVTKYHMENLQKYSPEWHNARDLAAGERLKLRAQRVAMGLSVDATPAPIVEDDGAEVL